MTVKFGGLDMAMRVDNSALIVLKLEDGVLEQVGQKVWPHISLDKVADDMLKIQHIEKMKAVGYDRLGIGDGARQLFSKEVPLRDIISSQTNKLACSVASYSLAGIPRPTVAKMNIKRQPLDLLADMEIEKQLKSI